MRISVSTLILLVGLAQPALATMPSLTDMPQRKTLQACLTWANQQTRDDDVYYMWGMLEDGTDSKSVAIRRLASYCMTGNSPDIVGLGSSVGVDAGYCESYPATRYCEHVGR